MTVQLLHQRTPHQCAIATIAMATGRDYDLVLELATAGEHYEEGIGCRNEGGILKALGYSSDWVDGDTVGDFIDLRCPFGISAEYFRRMAWGRRAIMAVPSLNIPGGWHSVFWDGREVFDPNPPDRKRYTAFKDLLPNEMILFSEGAAPLAAAA